MKKIISTVLAVTMLVGAFSLSGCSALKKAAEKESWTTAVMDKVGDKLAPENVTEFYLNGEVYHFPMEIQDLADKGWKFQRASDATIKMRSNYYTSTGIVMVDDNDHSITINAFNKSGEEKCLSNTSVLSIYLGSKAGEVMFAGGLAVFETKMDDYDAIDSYMNPDSFENCEITEPDDGGRTYSIAIPQDDGREVTAEFDFDKLTITTGNFYELSHVYLRYEYFSEDYDFCTDIIGTIRAVMENDPSQMNADWLKGQTPEEYVADYRGETGYLTYTVMTLMGFEFESYTPEQVAKIDEIIAATYDINQVDCARVDADTVILSLSYYKLDDVYATAYEMIATDYPDLSLDDYATSEECFFAMAEELLKVYANPVEYGIAKRPATYTAEGNSQSQTLWDDIIFCAMGMYDYI